MAQVALLHVFEAIKDECARLRAVKDVRGTVPSIRLLGSIDLHFAFHSSILLRSRPTLSKRRGCTSNIVMALLYLVVLSYSDYLRCPQGSSDFSSV